MKSKEKKISINSMIFYSVSISVIQNSVKSKIFADDLKLYSVITNDLDMINLQIALDMLDS